jgi:hypothetical protein
MPTSEPTTIVVTVTSIYERDKLIKTIYTNLTKEPSTTFIVQQDQVNRIKIFHNIGKGVRVLIRTYLVLVIPVIIDLSQLNSIYGIVDFKLDATIKHLLSFVTKLQALQGRKIIKGNTNVKELEQLVKQLCGTND